MHALNQFHILRTSFTAVSASLQLSLSFYRAGLVMAATTFSAFPALFELFPLVSPMAAPIAAQPVMHPALFSRTLELQLFFSTVFSQLASLVKPTSTTSSL